MREDQIALQLWTVRRPAAADLAGTLGAVAAAGYRAVEVAGLPDVPVPVLASLLHEHGLAAVAAHVGLDRLRHERGSVVDRLRALDCGRAVVPMLPDRHRRDTDAVRRAAADLASAADALAPDGIRVGYHNHDFEFAPLDDTTIWAILLAELPPQVEIELDVYWASVAGRDPVAEIRALGGRVSMLHLKDRAAGAEGRDVPVGQGMLPMADIVEAGRTVGVDCYIVEQDEPENPIRDIATALAHLRSLAAA